MQSLVTVSNKSKLSVFTAAFRFFVVWLVTASLCMREEYTSSDGRVVKRPLGSCRLGFDSESGQLSDFKIGIQSFPA